MGVVWSMAVKEWKLLLRDPGGLALLFVMPGAFILVFSVALQGVFSSTDDEERMEVLVLDEDGGEVGRRIVEALEKGGHFRVVRDLDGGVLDRAAVVSAVESGSTHVAVIIPRGSSDAASGDGSATVRIIADPLLPAEVEIALHGSTVAAIQLLAIQSLRAALDAVPSSRPGGRDALKVEVRHAAAGGRIVYPDSVQQNVPAWTIFGLFWIVQVLALSVITERTSGAYARILVAPPPVSSYILGKAIPYFVVNLVQAILMFGIGILVLPLVGAPRLEVMNVPATVLVTVCVSLAAIGLGLFMSTLSRSATLVGSISAVMLVIMTALAGIMVPTYVMPELMQRTSLLVPQGWALVAYQHAIARGRSTADILPHVGVLVAWAAALFAMAAARIRTMDRPR